MIVTLQAQMNPKVDVPPELRKSLSEFLTPLNPPAPFTRFAIWVDDGHGRKWLMLAFPPEWIQSLAEKALQQEGAEKRVVTP